VIPALVAKMHYTKNITEQAAQCSWIEKNIPITKRTPIIYCSLSFASD